MQHILRRTWAEINLDNLIFNIDQIKDYLPDETKIMAVVKANAYGHGYRAVSETLQEHGIDFFAVSNIDEAIALRDANIRGSILILGYTPIQEAKKLAEYKLIQTIFSLEYAEALNKACHDSNINIKAHIKLDTGMSRIGFNCNQAFNITQITQVFSLEHIAIEGVFTHFSSADMEDDESIQFSKAQLEKFKNTIASIEDKGHFFKFKHIQNSAGIAFYNEDALYSYARAGIIIYGLPPSNMIFPFELKPVMSFKSIISFIKDIDKGDSVSYGRTFTADHKMRVATIPAGYADGYSRLLSNKAHVLINGKKAKILGNVCMDQMIVDVSDIPDADINQEVVLVGESSNLKLTFTELANIIGTINYELICNISPRVPRVYIKGKERFWDFN